MQTLSVKLGDISNQTKLIDLKKRWAFDLYNLELILNYL